jgi:hypothetical protein
VGARPKLVPHFLERHRVCAGIARLEAGERAEETARDADVGRFQPQVEVVERVRAVAAFAFALLSAGSDSQADSAKVKANITISVLVIIILRLKLRRLGNQSAGEAFLSRVNDENGWNVSDLRKNFFRMMRVGGGDDQRSVPSRQRTGQGERLRTPRKLPLSIRSREWY